MVFDDCYEHEVWNRTDEERVLLLFDLWHPELAEEVMLFLPQRVLPSLRDQAHDVEHYSTCCI